MNKRSSTAYPKPSRPIVESTCRKEVYWLEETLTLLPPSPWAHGEGGMGGRDPR